MEVVVSAPGKVLITGGYLVLERPNAGIVLSTTARFYAIVRPIHDEIKPDSWAWAWTDVKVTSPQLSREASYKLSLKNCTLQCTSSRESTNPFVEQAIQYCVAACNVVITEKERKDAFDKLLLQGLDITILGSNGFYSYRSQIEERGLPLTPEALASLPPFSSITFNTGDTQSRSKPEVAKTGLGSSAAMTTSVVASLLHYLGAVSIPFPGNKSSENGNTINSGLDLVHAIAQSAHCIAQGKIGSGFDVSSAVYGSQKYVRFSPQVLSSTQVLSLAFSLLPFHPSHLNDRLNRGSLISANGQIQMGFTLLVTGLVWCPKEIITLPDQLTYSVLIGWPKICVLPICQIMFLFGSWKNVKVT